MKKWLLIILPILCFTFGLRAQESLIGNLDYAMLDRLIELAKTNYPKRKINQVNEKMAASAVTQATLGYLDMFNAHYIYRPDNRPSVDELNPYVFNGFQFSVRLNISDLVAKPLNVRRAKQQRQIARLQSEDFDLMLENDVKAKYYSYIQSSNELKNRTSAAQDAKSLFARLQGQFELGEVDLDTYSNARTNVANANSTLIQTEVTYLLAKDALEELIGVKLDELK